MKKLVVLLALAFAATGHLFAATETVGGYTWTYEIVDGEARIEKTAAFGGYSYAVSPRPMGTLEIPSSLGDYPVTSIGEFAFEDCSELTSVTIPSSVTSIGPCAFWNCSSLTSVTIPEGVTSIEHGAFMYCSGMTSVTIPLSVTEIGEHAFYVCNSLTSVTVRPSLWAAFKDSAVTSLTIPEGVTSIEEGVFSGSGLTSVTIPSSVTSIGASAFYGCGGLTSVTIPEGVTSIGDTAFGDCGNLISVTIPSSVTSIWGSSFYGCNGLTSISVAADNPNYRSADGCLLSKDGRTLVRGAGVGAVTIPSGVTALGDGAFGGCESLTSVTIPEGVTSIGARVFENCIRMTSVTIPSGVTTIGERAFYHCYWLPSVTIPPSVTSMGEDAFVLCASLNSVYVGIGDSDRVQRLFPWPSRVHFIESWMPASPSGTGTGGMMPGTGTTPGTGGGTGTVPTPPAPDLNGGDTSIAAGVVAPYEAAACVYNGLLKDGGRLAGTLEVKVAKMKNGAAKVTATALLGAQKLAFKGGVADASGAVTPMSAGGMTLALALGADGLGGMLGSYVIDGARDVFSGKSADDKAASASALSRWQGAVNIVSADAVLSVVIAAKGKAKVASTVGGVKVSATAQLVVGAADCAVPILIAKKASLACTLRLGADGSVSVEGLPGAVAGKPGALKAGAAFRMDAAALAAVLPGLFADHLPDGLSVAGDAKWLVAGGARPGKVVLQKGTQEVDASKLGDNPSGLKLTYKAKDGSFKGSFKAYALENGKVKAYAVNVEGVLVGDIGHGAATLKKPACAFPVAVE